MLLEEEEGKEGGRESETLIGCLLYTPPQLGIKPGMYPDWELRWQLLAYGTMFQPTEPYWTELVDIFMLIKN